MGTKVQHKSYLPEYYSMRDLNEDANSSSWPTYYEDRNLNRGLYYNRFLPRPPTDAYLGHDREVLKQTMLKHESIFRKQVLELHRLYKIQRDLMDEIKKKELHEYQIPVETSHSSPFAPQMPSEDARKMWHVNSLPLVTSTCTQLSFSDADNMKAPLNFIKGHSMQAGPVPVQNGVSSKDCELETKSKKFRRRFFDLQLPADEYVDSEEGECFEEEKVFGVSMEASYPPKKNCEVASGSDVKLSLGSGGNAGCQGDASRSDICLRSTNGLADLNEPIQVDEPTASVDFLGPMTCNGEIPGRDLSVKSISRFLGLPTEFFQKTQKGSDNGTCSSNVLHLENEGNRREWLSYNFEAGQSRSNLNYLPRGSCSEKLPKPSEPLQVALKKAHELPTFLPSDQSKIEPWRERAFCGLEISERSHDISNYNYLGPGVASCVPSLYPLGPKFDLTNSGSPSLSSWRKPMICLSQNPTAVQALPCLNTSASLSKSSKSSIQSPEMIGDNWPHNSISRLNPIFGSEVSCRNGFYHGSQSESKDLQVRFPSIGFDDLNCSNHSSSASEHLVNHGPTKYFRGSEFMDVKSAKDMNLNVVLQNEFREEVVPQHDLVIADGERRHEDPPRGLPWLRAKPPCNGEPAKGRGSSNPLESGFLQTSFQSFSNKIEIDKGPSQNFVQNSTPASCFRDDEPKRIVVGCLSNRKILGFPIFDKPHISKDQSSSLSSPSTSHHHPSEVEDFENSEKVGVPTLPDAGIQLPTEDLVVEKGLDKNLSEFRYNINLNLCINEEEAPSTPSVPRAIMKIATDIDLEAPVVPETEGFPSGGESLGNKHETPFLSSQHEDGEPQNKLVRIAAEAIVAISSSGGHNCLEDASCHPAEAFQKDSLCWFAEVVSSYNCDLESEVGVVSRGKVGGDHEESSSSGIDYFESMTLMLTETKVEEYCSKPQLVENPNEEETGATLFPSRLRKGQARRGRQRRDFQRDILPGLVSLSRHEVTEDLQRIGGMMKATGHPWQVSLTRRNAARNGWARGRRWLQGPAPTVAASIECPSPLEQPKNSELGLEERSLTGWGKTTRRPRRQRCPAGNTLLLPLTKYRERP
ncbi:hypothetical protein HHK36_024282 [Tetracentron sinense]|uniref:Uncharacterized protein n=1 Tax=Tetracentron sinense TaxID=13715 RepID=A0A835D3Z8_TETSI|nr:hypothetical protein HHK36_024282 [Tetracentron sinense]